MELFLLSFYFALLNSSHDEEFHDVLFNARSDHPSVSFRSISWEMNELRGTSNRKELKIVYSVMD